MVILLIVVIFIVLPALILFSASLNMGWGFYMPAITKLNAGEKEIMLTFDDGPHPLYTPAVLDILKERGEKAVFFCIGERAFENPELIMRMVNEGHKVGIHSMNHSAGFTFASKSMVEGDIESCRKILSDISGTTIELFRPPFGVTNPNIARAIKKLNLKNIGWSIRSFDTVSDSNKVVKKIDKELHNGAVVLLHDRLPSAPVTLTGILDVFEKRGYKTTVI